MRDGGGDFFLGQDKLGAVESVGFVATGPGPRDL